MIDAILMNIPIIWLLWLLSRIFSPLRRRYLNRFSSQVRVDLKEASFEYATHPAPICFRIRFDSKASVRMTTEHVAIVICLGQGLVPVHTYRWSREDRCSKELGTADDLPVKGSADITFRYTPLIYQNFSTERIYLEGYVKFRCVLGNIYIPVSERVDLKFKEKIKAIGEPDPGRQQVVMGVPVRARQQ